jgi:hypothetical protein
LSRVFEKMYFSDFAIQRARLSRPYGFDSPSAAPGQ